MIDEKLVIPGEFLGTSEEFTGGKGTFERNGDVYSSITGKVSFEKKTRTIEVDPVTSSPPVPTHGDEIIGKIRSIKDQIALVNIDMLVGNEKREPAVSEVGAIHVSNVSEDYIDNVGDEFNKGDIVKAKVIVDKLGSIDLTTNEPQLGVVSARCTKCGSRLMKEGKKLVCKDCGNTENRKISSDFGKGV
ncbi:RNA-binding protein [archaeon SCG-AAA382B04]|nr:RNA-binding protein [archaeon SCG-AAA382B04]